MMRFSLNDLQPLGRALMLPIAVLPIAGLLLRLGQPDMLNIGFVAAAGDAIFSNLGLLFAIGVGVGLARENHGAAGMAGAVCFFVTVEGAKALLNVPPDVGASFAEPEARALAAAAWKAGSLAKLGVPAGILSGLIAGIAYNRFSNINLPEYLAFFGGRRFVPIVAGLGGLLLAAMFGLGFPVIAAGIATLSEWVVSSGNFGLFAYGILNRLLIITGLHHIINNIAWFILGDFHGATGDLKRFFAGDPTAGAFMSGFFPVMMFGLPAACLAMYRAALPGRRKEVAGLFLSLGLTSFLTGVTEPIEFTFIFIAPLLYALHAFLTGVSMVVMNLLGVKLGFGFSAGLLDYLLNYGLATQPLLLIPVGLAYFLIYYASFHYCIVRFDLKTPGRDIVAQASSAAAPPNEVEGFFAALGGRENIAEVTACTTRLRLNIVQPETIDEAALKSLGVRGVIRVGKSQVQLVVGPRADQLSGELSSALRQEPGQLPQHPQMQEQQPLPVSALQPDLILALGGDDNIVSVETDLSRQRFTVADMTAVHPEQLGRMAARGWVQASPTTIHILADA